MGLAGCENACGRQSGLFNVTDRPNVVFISTLGTSDVIATCGTGEQMLGGGYTLDPPYANPGEIPSLPFEFGDLIVEANYPNTPSSWTVSVFNPDKSVKGPNSGRLVIAHAYCLTTENFSVGTEIPSPGTGPIQGDGVVSIATTCPQGSVVTGGGYKLSHSKDYAGTWNDWILASLPFMPDRHRVGPATPAIGWEVRGFTGGRSYGLTAADAPTATVYAICATQNLVAGAPAYQGYTIAPPPHPAFWFVDPRSSCAADEFTTGGGYEILGDPLIPHPVYESAALPDLGEWRMYGLSGYQSSSYTFRPCPPNQNPDCGAVKAWAACIKTPYLGGLSVKITSPAANSLLPIAQGGVVTLPITFTAVATDETGSSVSATYEWTDAWLKHKTHLGSSAATFSTTLSTGNCERGPLLEHHISVKAVDARGFQALDNIRVYAGRDCFK